MKVEMGTVIPAGFVMSFLTWENDADDYRSNQLMGLDHREVEYLTRIVPLFASKNCHRNKGYGNSEFGENLVFALIEKTQDDERDLLDKFFAIKVPAGFDGSEDFDNYDEDDVLLKIYEIVGYPVQYDYGFVRVMDTVEVYEFANEFVLPKLPESKVVFKR